jgi:hypothetical protein
MSNYNDTSKLGKFLSSDNNLCSAILALEDFINNVDEEHPSYHLLSMINKTIKNSHNDLQSHFTHQFESLFQEKITDAPFKLFEVIEGGGFDFADSGHD